ncbi:hypothetical protein ACP70R_040759 [Stipagrostis hirtigluma subsp. patula]
MAKFAVLATVLLVAVATAATISCVHGARTTDSLELQDNPEAAWLVAGLDAPLSAPVDAGAPGASGVPLEEAADGPAVAEYSAAVLDNKTPVFGP